MKVYLCGPINGCFDDECVVWRESAKRELRSVATTIDPMARDYRGKEDYKYSEIVELDKIDVAQSDVLLVNYVKPSVGTSMEILYAWQLGKRIILVCNLGSRLSPWLRYHCTHIVHSFESAYELIRGLR